MRRTRRRTCSRCSRTPPASCTWATSATTCWARSSRTSAAGTATRSCARWASTRSACPRRTRRSSEGGHPREVTERNIAAIRAQMERMGWAIDWDRVLATHEPEYYRWTQWLFLRFFERGLAYRKEAPVKWCPNDQTVLANEQVIDGRCERCGAEVEAQNLEQWFFRITAYADALLDEMELLEDWPERVLTMQRNWIGRSEGAERPLPRRGARRATSRSSRRGRTRSSAPRSSCWRPSTRSSRARRAAREHEEEVLEYVTPRRRRAPRSSARRRRRTASSPAATRRTRSTGERMPIWVADYVLMEYGTGAIMGVPAHDERDFAFARAVRAAGRARSSRRRTARGPVAGGRASSSTRENEVLVNSGEFTGLPAPEAKQAIVELARAERPRRSPTISYRLRDWLLSRQRYWGCPDPDRPLRRVRDRPGAGRATCPSLLPEVDGVPAEGPLAARGGRGLGATRPARSAAAPARRETDTMDTFVDSSWYFIRYADPQNDDRAVRPGDRRLLAAGRPVHRRDRARDPAPALRALLHEGDERPRPGRLPRAVRAAVHAGDAAPPRREDVQVEGERDRPRRVRRALRRGRGAGCTCCSSGPVEQDAEWQDAGFEGIVRFLHRLWRVVMEQCEQARGRGRSDTPLARKAHGTIAKVTDDIGRRFALNTPIAAVMELVNEISQTTRRPGGPLRGRDGRVADPAVRVAHRRGAVGALGHERLWEEPWPEADPALLEHDTFELVVQVNGKVRGRVEVPRRACRGRAGRARAGAAEGAGAPGRQGDPQGDRRAAASS